MSNAQTAEVDRNFDVFQRRLSEYLTAHRGRYALMKDAAVVEFFDKPGDAYQEGITRFGSDVFSIQEVTDEPIDLGFYSHVGR